MSENRVKMTAAVVGIVVAVLGSWVGVAGFTASIVQRQTQATILAVAIEARSEARIALQKLQDPVTGVESRVTRLEALQEEVRRTLDEIRADVKRLVEKRP